MLLLPGVSHRNGKHFQGRNNLKICSGKLSFKNKLKSRAPNINPCGTSDMHTFFPSTKCANETYNFRSIF